MINFIFETFQVFSGEGHLELCHSLAEPDLQHQVIRDGLEPVLDFQ